MYSSLKKSIPTPPSFSPKKVISFVGNMQQNVMEILTHLNCRCGCRYGEFKDILLIFGDKISKLRSERDLNRSQYAAEIESLKIEIYHLQEHIQRLQNELKNTKSHTEDQSDQFSQQKYQSQESNQYDSFNDIFKLEAPINNEPIQHQLFAEKLKTEENGPSLQRLVRKYNIGWEQLEHIIGEYLEDQEKSFQNDEQRKLYRLGRKLQKDIWIKKVKKDVEMLRIAKTRG